MSTPPRSGRGPIPYAPSAEPRPASSPDYFGSAQYHADIRALRKSLMADEEFVRMFPPVEPGRPKR